MALSEGVGGGVLLAALLALVLSREVGAEVVTRAREQGLLLNSPRPDLLRFMPALNSTPAEIGESLEMLGRIFEGIAG